MIIFMNDKKRALKATMDIDSAAVDVGMRLKGFVSSFEEARQAMSELEKDTTTSYSSYKSDKNFGNNNVFARTNYKIMWKDKYSTKKCRIVNDGVPFVVLATKVCDCQHGKDRHRRRKERQKTTDSGLDHAYDRGPKFLTQETKKMDCPAQCVFREVVKFPLYKFAECLVRDDSLHFADTKEDLIDLRRGLAIQLLEAAGNIFIESVQNHCRTCCTMDDKNNDFWVCCDSCVPLKWFHNSCLDKPFATKPVDIPFICGMCMEEACRAQLPKAASKRNKHRRVRLTPKPQDNTVTTQPEESNLLFREIGATCHFTKTMIRLLCEVQEKDDLGLVGVKVEDQSIEDVVMNSVLPDLRAVLDQSKCHSKTNPGWRHFKYLADQSIDTRRLNSPKGCIQRHTVLGQKGMREITLLVLKNMATFKPVTKRMIGYTSGDYLTVKNNRNEKLANILEDKYGQNMNRGMIYFRDVVIPEASHVRLTFTEEII